MSWQARHRSTSRNPLILTVPGRFSGSQVGTAQACVPNGLVPAAVHTGTSTPSWPTLAAAAPQERPLGRRSAPGQSGSAGGHDGAGGENEWTDCGDTISLRHTYIRDRQDSKITLRNRRNENMK